jgi:hypothetical protein
MELVISLGSDLPENTPHPSYRSVGTSEHGNEPSGSLKDGGFLG